VTPVLEVERLGKVFRVGRRGHQAVRAVHGVSLQVAAGETLALVGESGSGKTTVGRLVLRLETPSTGRITFKGVDITTAARTQLRPVRRGLQMVFQDPLGSLDPLMSVEATLVEPLANFGLLDRQGRRRRAAEVIEQVGLPRRALEALPGELSGGQRQRVAIARALVSRPELVVSDEPTASLDASVQAQVLNLLLQIQREEGVAYLLISHSLNVVRHLSDRVAVMYLGEVVETGSVLDVCERPRHPYTEALVDANPRPDPDYERATPHRVLEGDPPSPLAPPAGCPFHTRCPYAQERCRVEKPHLSGHGGVSAVACHFPLGQR
jgi:oligopeptide/dipeptide ABC transporter ATP-binding protein